MQTKTLFVGSEDEFDNATIKKFFYDSLVNYDGTLCGSILKTKYNEHFVIIEDRKQLNKTDTYSTFKCYTIAKDEETNEPIFKQIARITTGEQYNQNNYRPVIYYLSTIYIEQDYRDKDVGSTIFTFLCGLAYDRGFDSLYLYASNRFLPSRTDPTKKVDANINFYEKNGCQNLTYDIIDGEDAPRMFMRRITLFDSEKAQEHIDSSLIGEISEME